MIWTSSSNIASYITYITFNLFAKDKLNLKISMGLKSPPGKDESESLFVLSNIFIFAK